MRRAEWAETWMAVASAVALRSPCERRQAGAVIVDAHNRVVATGYNGPARGDRRACAPDCPRFVQGSVPPTGGYSSCLTTHAEANALLFCDRRDREGGTIYVNTAMCMDCAKLVANSGLLNVVMRVLDGDEHRRPTEIAAYLESCGVTVRAWTE